MSLVGELTRVIYPKKYYNVTFSVNSVPIVTVRFQKDKKVIVIANNLEELRCYEFDANKDINEFVKDVENMLIYSGIDPMIRKMNVQCIDFYGEPYLKGKILQNKIIITQQEIMIDDDGDEVTFNNRDEVTAVIMLSGLTIAQVIGAFVLQYYA